MSLSDPLITTVSQVRDFWACPERWYLKHVCPKREPKRKTTALTAGVLWHQFMEKLLLNPAAKDPKTQARLDLVEWLYQQFNDNISSLAADGLIDRSEALERERESLCCAAMLWTDWQDVETLVVEKAFQLNLGDVIIRGRLDRVIRLNGRLGHQQHRTLARSKSIDRYLSVFHRNPYEGVYWAMLQQEYGEEPFGTLLDLTRKLVPKSLTKDPESAMQQHPVPISWTQANVTLDNVIRTARKMSAFVEDPTSLYSNPDRDLGPFGNSFDPYFQAVDTRDHEYMLDDEQWQATEDRYTELDQGPCGEASE